MKTLHLKITDYLGSYTSSPVAWFYEILLFGYKNALACGFGVFIFLALATSRSIAPYTGLHRYDFLLVVLILAQVFMYLTKIESKRELVVIMGFHLLGLVLEIHKINVGSWSYPEEGFFKLGGVPLYSGFMYASVASYICRAWDLFRLRIIDWPSNWQAILLGIGIYLNFFTNAYFPDVRWYLVFLLVFIFRKTEVSFTSSAKERRMPLLMSFILIGFFIWLAENIATFLGAWKYTYQHANWQMVDIQKLSSWSLMVIVSIVIVFQMKMVFSKEK